MNFLRAAQREAFKQRMPNKLRMQLAALNTATAIEDMNIPGYRLHPLKGDRKSIWAITVSGNWRITFQFTDTDAYIVNYEDYH